tara:strand:- start:1142 stop:2152 length:1011 start_codon:yes stop_codon:yes gene_type:complete
MSDAYGISTELSMGNTAGNNIASLNRSITDTYGANIKTLQSNLKAANPKYSEISGLVESGADSVGGGLSAVKGGYRIAQNLRGGDRVGEMTNVATELGSHDNPLSTGGGEFKITSKGDIAETAARGIIDNRTIKSAVSTVDSTAAPEEATESVIKNGIGLLDKGGGVASAISGVSGALTGINVLAGATDAIQDFSQGGIAGKNIQEKRANVAGIASGAADLAGLAIKKGSEKAASTAAGEAGGEALGEAAVLEEAGAAADSTGIGAIVGIGLGIAGAAAGVYGAYEEYEGKKTQQKTAQSKLSSAQSAGVPTQSIVDSASSGAEVRSSSRGISAVS